MPLSEDEERILKEMADNLYRDDPSLVSTLRTGQTKTRRNSLALGVLLSITGMAVLVLGIPTGIWLLGLVGFITALAGVYLIFGYKPVVKSENNPGATPLRKAPSSQGSEGFMDKVNRRWENRKRESDLD